MRMQNNEMPKDYVKLISDPNQPKEFIMVCQDRLHKLEIEMGYDLVLDDMANDTIAGHIYTINKTVLPDVMPTTLGNEKLTITAAEAMPNKSVVVGFSNGAIAYYNTLTSSAMTRVDSLSGGAGYPITTFLLTSLHVLALSGSNEFLFFELADETRDGVDGVKFVSNTARKGYKFKKEKAPLLQAFFNQAMTEIFAFGAEGGVFRIQIKAERREEADPDEDNDKKVLTKPKTNLSAEAIQVGTYHVSQLVAFESIPGTSRVVSASKNGLILVHDAENQSLLSSLKVEAHFTCGCINSQGTMLFLGSSKGVLRVFSLTDPKSIKLVHTKKFLRESSIIGIKVSPDHAHLALIGEDSDMVFLLSGQPEQGFEPMGFTTLPGTVLDIGWSSMGKLPDEGGKYKNMLDVIVRNGLLVSMAISRTLGPNPKRIFTELSAEDIVCRCRRIDFDITKVVVDFESGDVFCTGGEKSLRKYKHPDEKDLLKDFDLRVKPPTNPAEEVEGHELETITLAIQRQGSASFIVSGGADGVAIQRPINNLNNMSKSQCMSYPTGGISSISAFQQSQGVLVGGFDGSLNIYSSETLSFGRQVAAKDSEVSQLPAVPLESDDETKFYEVLLEEESRKAREKEKNHMQQQAKESLFRIREDLKELLRINKNAEDIEKIERDEFCLDLEARTRIISEGEQSVEAIKKAAQREVISQELTHKKIMRGTFAKMDTHFKTLTGLASKVIVPNFVIRKKEKPEIDKWKLVSNLRAVELAEKKWKKEKKIAESLELNNILANYDKYKERKDPDMEAFLLNCPDSKAIISKPENFICNLKPGKQKVLLLDHAKREDERQKKKAEAMEYDKKTDNNDNHAEAPDRPDPTGYRLHRMSRNPRGKKKMPGANAKDDGGEGNEFATQDEDLADDDEGKQDAEFMYGAFELFTPKQKKTQVIFLKNMIFRVKKIFNKEFEAFCKYRAKELERIGDLNTLIQEQYMKLGEDPVLFQAQPNIVENPRLVLELEAKEIPFTKYLTKREKKELEEKRIKEEARLKALSKDDAGIRALKQMMNNTLEEKQESILKDELVEEEWMKLPVENLTDEQKAKLEDFKVKKAKYDEEAKKLKQKLKQDLDKHQEKIAEICASFDHKLTVLFNKRLEYQYRIYEQENYIIKLIQSVQAEKNYSIAAEDDLKRQKYQEDDMVVNSTFTTALEKSYSLLGHEIKRIEAQIEQDCGKNSKDDIQSIFDKFKKIMDRETESLKEYKEENYRRFQERNSHYIRRVNESDLLFEVEYSAQKLLGLYDPEEFRQDITEIERGRRGGDRSVLFERFKKVIETERLRRKLNQELQLLNTKINAARSKQHTMDLALQEIKASRIFHMQKEDEEQINIFVQFRFLKRIVEIPNTNFMGLEDAILIDVSHIHKLNKEIKALGDAKVHDLQDHLNGENNVKLIRHAVEEYILMIEDLIYESMAITRLKVTRQLQAALGEEKEMEREEKNLEEQIKTLKLTREKRISDMETKKKEMRKEIEAITLQNEKINNDGVKLKETVEERKKVCQMMYGNTSELEEEQEEEEEEEEDMVKNWRVAFLKESAEERQKERDKLVKKKKKDYQKSHKFDDAAFDKVM